MLKVWVLSILHAESNDSFKCRTTIQIYSQVTGKKLISELNNSTTPTGLLQTQQLQVKQFFFFYFRYTIKPT